MRARTPQHRHAVADVVIDQPASSYEEISAPGIDRFSPQDVVRVYLQHRRVSERAMLLSFISPLFPGPIRLSLRPGSSTLALGMNHVLWFDGAGRLITAYRDGRMYKRGLDHRVMAKWRPWTIGRPEYIRQDLADEEKARWQRASSWCRWHAHRQMHTLMRLQAAS